MHSLRGRVWAPCTLGDVANVLGTGRPHPRIRGAETTSVPTEGPLRGSQEQTWGTKSPTAHLTPGQAQCIEALGGTCGPSSPGSMELASARAQPPAPRSFLPAARTNRNCGHPPPMGPQFPAPSPSLCPRGFGVCITHHTPPNRASWVPAPPPWARGSQVLPTAAGRVHASPLLPLSPT